MVEAEGNPLSFLHVCRSEIDLPAETDPHDDRVYHTARANLDRLLQDGVLRPDGAPSLFLYELSQDGRSQVGVVGCVHVTDYADDVILKHEKTRRDKEDDRTRHILELGVHPEPVFLTVRDRADLNAMIEEGTQAEPVYDFVSDGVRNRVWQVADPDPYTDLFDKIPCAYVADGHHRCASAWRAGVERRESNPQHDGTEEYNWFPAVLFPAGQLNILPYHRVVRDLSGLRPSDVLGRLRALGRVVPVEHPDPPSPGSFGIYLGGNWFLLTLDPDSIPVHDPVQSLDAALLETQVLGPVLGVGDIRTDPRVDFVGGKRGTQELQRRVDRGEAAIAFALHPVTVDQLLAVSDGGGIMPPKTTWFEPKLRSGLFLHSLD